MKLRFRLFVRHHGNGLHTVLVPGVPQCAAYGGSLPALRRQVEEQLRRRLAQGWRKASVDMHWSLLLTPEAGQWRVDVPALDAPPLTYVARDAQEALRLAPGQLQDYFRDRPEALSQFALAVHEELAEIVVQYTPDAAPAQPGEAYTPYLQDLARNLTALAAAGQLPPAYEREAAV